MNVTPHQLHLLHHTLGLRPDRRESFRNHFLAGEGHHDQPDLEALEDAGLMRRTGAPAFCEPGDVVFVCTDAGKAYAIEHLPPEPKRTKYEEYLRNDGCESFAEYMGINKPMLQQRFSVSMNGYEYQMYRIECYQGWHSVDVAGEWSKTKKGAKASYKAALRAKKEAIRAR